LPAEVVAPAKLTLSLRVTGLRADGYHLLDAEMVTLDLADGLTLSSGDGLEVEVVGHQLGAAPAGAGQGTAHRGWEVPIDASNLVCRALALVGRRAHVRLVKRIPAGAGLGGGSADAAAVLRWAGAVGSEGLLMAARLGADVPFCLAGGGRARVQGVGEILQPLPFEEVAGSSYTLLTPPFGVSTAVVYRAWDEMGGPRGDGPNDLEPAALQVEPRLALWRDRLRRATGLEPVLAGSGSTWFVPGEHSGEGCVVVRVAKPERPAGDLG
jgi:4-diphosphocytidyl-2-C-methyl-D-erythritol kinase